MAVVRPFKAVRPKVELAEKIAALPYDVMNSDEARKAVENNPYSFLHVDKAEVDLPVDVDIYDKRVYEKARENLYKMIDNGLMVQDEEPMFFIYRLIMNGRQQTGIVGCTSIDDYINDVIKKHEHTREEKERDRINHVDYCNANTGPIFMTYRWQRGIQDVVDKWTQRAPLYSFTSEDGISHVVWAVDNKSEIEKIGELFNSIPNLYIADGHHRAASAVKVGIMRREQNPGYTGHEEFNFFLSVIFPDRELHIMDYNRVVKDLNGLSKEDFLGKVSEKFQVEKLSSGKGPYRPERRHEFGMYLDSDWYKLVSRENTVNESHPVERLDVSILQKNLLEPVLGIEDPRTDMRIDFVGGIRGLLELQRRVDIGDMKVAFSMYPTTIEDLMDIADSGLVMPPKSTWFEPKLRSGLFIHVLE